MKLTQRGTCLVLLVAGLGSLPICAEAQLSAAMWDEAISLTVSNSSTAFHGADLSIPEPRTETLSGAGYSVTGSVEFGSAKPPVGIAEVTWDLVDADVSLDLSSIVSIDFQVRVVETATPPVSVASVPVHVVAAGSASVEDVFGSRATSFFRFQVIGSSIISNTLDVSGDSETPISDSFTIDQTTPVPLSTIVLVGMSASASMNRVSAISPFTGSATGMVDPVIEISDEMIPGTTSSYRDFFAIEFSEGYAAQTPVQRITFGELKWRFGRGR